MPTAEASPPPSQSPSSANLSAPQPKSYFLHALAVLGLLFAKPLFELATFALDSELFSHVILIPFVGAWLAWIYGGKPSTTAAKPPGNVAAGIALSVIGLGGTAAYWWYSFASRLPSAEADRLAWIIGAFVVLVAAAACFTLDARRLRARLFPLVFLGLMIPFPTVVEEWIEIVLQHGSVTAAEWMLTIAGMPMRRDGFVLHLLTIPLEVARECSGIHSTLVLFIVSLVAGRVFLTTLWARATLTLVVIPLAILRNGFRVFTLAQLCVNLDPSWIDSPIHHHGGPLFFALSLIPFSVALWSLRRFETRRRPVAAARA